MYVFIKYLLVTFKKYIRKFTHILKYILNFSNTTYNMSDTKLIIFKRCSLTGNLFLCNTIYLRNLLVIGFQGTLTKIHTNILYVRDI